MRVIRSAVAAVLTLLAVCGGVAAQDIKPAGDGFRAEAEPDLLGRRGRAIVGWLYNDRGVAYTNVRVRVDVLDSGGRIVGSGEAYIYGNVPAHGRSYFFVPVPSYADSYRVTVIRFDRVEME
ncbi:MAG TPA: FxLYD domain-containing protein [Candidatus Acidoferrum sp.]|nr:FxLYD domain-containing protein [Candidatus Acidoferrum sp.]